MYAIVEIAGQQFKVAKDQRLYVHRLNAKEGAKVEFDNVLLVENGGKVAVGAPVIEGAKVTAKVLGHLKGDKVIVFKKKRRKGYQKQNGHRQYLTQIQIDQIVEKGATKAAKATEEKAAPKAAAPKVEPKAKAEPKAESPAPEANNEA
jgi:large subunit ribosomal protein L21